MQCDVNMNNEVRLHFPKLQKTFSFNNWLILIKSWKNMKRILTALLIKGKKQVAATLHK